MIKNKGVAINKDFDNDLLGILSILMRNVFTNDIYYQFNCFKLSSLWFKERIRFWFEIITLI